MPSLRPRIRPWSAAGLTAATALLLLAGAPSTARADSVSITLDGRPLHFDVEPVIEQSVTMVPLRAILTPLGAAFEWNQERQAVTASLGETRIEAAVGSPTARVNGEPVPLAMPVLNREGRTLIPLRFFAEELGLQVVWDGESRTVHLSSRGIDRTVARAATRRPGDSLVVAAAAQIGAGYAWGGITPASGFDCSGFVFYLTGLLGVEMPRTSQEQFATGQPIRRADLAAGDLVFFTTYEPGASHVGVYDGQGGFIHAQSPEAGVTRTSLGNPWWAERYVGARRIFR